MYTITYLFNRCQLMTLTTPSWDVAYDVLTALRAARLQPRMWQGTKKAPQLIF